MNCIQCKITATVCHKHFKFIDLEAITSKEIERFHPIFWIVARPNRRGLFRTLIKTFTSWKPIKKNTSSHVPAASSHIGSAEELSVNLVLTTPETRPLLLIFHFQRRVLAMKIRCILISLGERQHFGFAIKLAKE
jgi:hypothetical protein